MWGQHFDCYHFRPSRSTVTHQTRVELGGHNLTLEFRPNGGRWSKTLYWEVLGNGGWAFDWCESQPANTTLTPRILDLNPPLNCGQTVTNGATCWIDRRSDVIVVANAPKYSVKSDLSGISAAYVPQFVGFSCCNSAVIVVNLHMYIRAVVRLCSVPCPTVKCNYVVFWLNVAPQLTTRTTSNG